MDKMIEMDQLTKHFGSFVAVDNISLSVAKGEVLGFLGPNGAGKSTTMRMLSGFLTPTFGKASVCGHDVEQSSLRSRQMLGYMPEGSPSYEDMTVTDFLHFVAAIRNLYGESATRHVEKVAGKVGLTDVLDKKIEILSKGYKRRVGLAQSILHDPPVLILDEPTDGLDPNQKHEVRQLIREMSPDKAIIISTHILEEVEAVCSRAVIIGSGRILADGTADELLKRLPEHNSVSIVLPNNIAESASNILGKIKGVDSVNKLDLDSTRVKLICLPSSGGEILENVSNHLKNNNITPLEIFKNKGDLDVVFRQITLQGKKY